MRITQAHPNSSDQSQRGFTLVELVTVVVVLGVLSAIVAPRFFSSSSFTEYVLQQRLLTAMRTLQTQSMHDTRPSFCYRLNLVSGSSGAFGPPTDNYQASNQANTCANTIDYSVPQYLRSDLNELSSKGVSLSAVDSGVNTSFINFDSLGRPLTSAGNCAAGCEFTFSGDVDMRVCVLSEGYIYAC